ncbi:hypothetical protein Arad_7880 [Rhizobium rhizogenes K84]|uniref:Gamma-glutamylcyclotransferase family protein n=2 Tax=Rhizobium rhizogenes TaxID=359 RepID=B9JP05_RHIR8|nr:hypothetical protein Arad_7880 [Rhizobium rhizogenes K84]
MILVVRREIPQMNHDNQIVFVYGTLKRGFANHDILTNARYAGTAVTMDPYPLIISESWNVPVVVDEVGSGYRVEGELFSVPLLDLKIMDEFEDVGRTQGYIRKRIVVEIVSGDQLTAWIYMKLREQIGQIKSDFLRAYPAINDYVPESLRGTA